MPHIIRYQLFQAKPSFLPICRQVSLAFHLQLHSPGNLACRQNMVTCIGIRELSIYLVTEVRIPPLALVQVFDILGKFSDIHLAFRAGLVCSGEHSDLTIVSQILLLASQHHSPAGTLSKQLKHGLQKTLILSTTGIRWMIRTSTECIVCIRPATLTVSLDVVRVEYRTRRGGGGSCRTK
jgi:hypothetical protein